MKITEAYIRKLIKEELENVVLSENDNANDVTMQKVKELFANFETTPEGKNAINLAKRIAKTNLSKQMKESIGDRSATLAAAGVLLGPLMAYALQKGLQIPPNLETNVLMFLAGVLGGGVIGLGADYLSDKARERSDAETNPNDKVPGPGSARWDTDPNVSQGPRYR